MKEHRKGQRRQIPWYYDPYMPADKGIVFDADALAYPMGHTGKKAFISKDFDRRTAKERRKG